MISLYNIMFVLSFLTLLVIFFLEVYNIMDKAEFYSGKTSFLLFIGLVLAWGVGLFVFLLDASELLFMVLFRLETLLFLVGGLFFVLDLLFRLSRQALGITGRHNSMDEHKKAMTAEKKGVW